MKHFIFTDDWKAGCIRVPYDPERGAPLYDAAKGYGFLRKTGAIPGREVHSSSITADGTGFYIRESEVDRQSGNELHFNHYGMVFRVDVPPGAYEIVVTAASDPADAWFSVSGMNAARLLEGGYWDAASKVPKRVVAKLEGYEWSFIYANGREWVEVEIEPRRANTTVGIREIAIRPLARNVRPAGRLPTIFLLGDSTVKTYTFSEAPMSGWGQVIGRLFDGAKANVVNYSMGGRSFRNAYAEGRLNDILVSGSAGDYILIQFGHNDEKEDERERFGRGATEDMYERYIKEIYVPAIRARGLIPLFVTPMSRVDGRKRPGHRYSNSFIHRKFPDILRRVGEELSIPVIDLNAASIEYYNEIGVEATTAIFMSIEAGETPGKTNDGSYANGHPADKIDGTHYKEALSKQFARLIVTDLEVQGARGFAAAADIDSFLREDVREAIASRDWSRIFPEVAKDTEAGPRAYYRNQIEKLLQLGVMLTDDEGNFRPELPMTVSAFIAALSKLLQLNTPRMPNYADGVLNREMMAAILYDVYRAKFDAKPKYMTDYNGPAAVSIGAEHDPNLDAGAKGIRYDPLVPFRSLTDADRVSPELAYKVKAAYELGLFRSEKGIVRGKNINGTELEPKTIVTRGKAAKSLYFMWVLGQPVNEENHIDTTRVPAPRF